MCVPSVVGSFRRRCSQVFVVGDFLQPVYDLAVERLLNGNVADARGCSGPVPMFLARRTHDDVPRSDFSLGTAPALHPAATRGDDQSLAKRVSMPRRMRAGL